jgi:cell division protein FtsL
MINERRKDVLFKALFLVVCGATGAGGSWTAIQVGQARMETRLEAVERTQTVLTGDISMLRQTKLDREENTRADLAQDQRIADLKMEMESIHADIRTLIQMQRVR